MKKVYLLGLAISSMITVQAQDCSGGRYSDEIFADFDLTANIVYGNNVTYNNSGSEDVELDVYEPTGDTETARPLLIFIHGGTFIAGSKEGSDVKPLAEMFARKGYVTSSMNYRLGMNNLLSGPDESDASEAVMRATQDARAAVRFFKRSVVENANPYGIDTNHIYLVGSSAGGFTALHLAYLDEVSEIPAFIDMNDPSIQGGLEGNTGNLGYTSTVSGIINLAGAIGDTTWIQAGDTPVLSLHGSEDGTVPFGTDMISVGFTEIMEVDGSQSIHLRTDNIGLKNCFKPFWGAGHIPHDGSAQYTDTTEAFMTQFLLHFVCGDPDHCYDYATSSLEDLSKANLQLYPNPVSTKMTITSDFNINSYAILDVNGRIVKEEELNNTNSTTINTSKLNDGIYFIKVQSYFGTETKKFIVK